MDDGSDDAGRDAAWIRQQRASLLRYLADAHVDHTGVAETPAWLVAPYVAIWSIGSKKRPGAIGWWAISGDVPTDFAFSNEIRNARMAMRVFSRRWKKASKRMAAGEQPDGFVIGPREAYLPRIQLGSYEDG